MISNIEVKGAAIPAANVARADDRLRALRLEIAHHLPGRLRLRSAAVKHDAAAAENARTAVAQIEGVHSVTANRETGSLLAYDTDVVAPDELLERLAIRGAKAPEMSGRGAPEWAAPLANVAKDWLINALAERLALALIGALV
jgi:Heavy metal associated domain 2